MALSRRVDTLLRDIEEDYFVVREEFLKEASAYLVYGVTDGDMSPVDTAAYVESHSIRSTKGAGRSRSSRNRPTHSNPSAARSQSLQTLISEAESLPREEVKVYMNNNSPHAQAVEHGNRVWKKRPFGYQIYTKMRREAGNILQKAVNIAKDRK